MAKTQQRSQHQFVWAYLKDRRSQVFLATLLSVLLALVTWAFVTSFGPMLQLLFRGGSAPVVTESELRAIFGPKLLKLYTTILGDASSHKSATALLERLPFFLLILAFLRTVCHALHYYLWQNLAEEVAGKIRCELMSLFLKLDPNFRASSVQKKCEERLAAIVSNDVTLLREYIAHFWGAIPRDLLQVFILSASLFYLSPKLSLLFFCGILPAVVVLRRLGKKLTERSQVALDDYSLIVEWVQKRLLGIETIKHYKTERLEYGKFSQLTSKLLKKYQRLARVEARTSPIMEIIGTLAFMLVVFAACYEIFSGRTSGAVLASFFVSLSYLSQSAYSFGKYFNSHRKAGGAVRRICDQYDQWFLKQKSDLDQRFSSLPEGALLRCQSLGVQYPFQVHPVFKNIDYTFLKGRWYWLVGASGAGKSTLVRSLLGLVGEPVREGHVLFSSQLTGFQKVGYLPQQMEPLAASVGFNVSYPELDFDRSRAVEALKKARIYDAVMAFPRGIDDQIGLGGQDLSGGQKQRVMLARIFYHRYRLIVLDEATSAIDDENEIEIRNELRDLVSKGHTVISISHRLPKNASQDTLLGVQNGQLKEVL